MNDTTDPAYSRVVEKIGLTYEKDARYYGVDVKYYAISREAYERNGSFYLCREQAV